MSTPKPSAATEDEFSRTDHLFSSENTSGGATGSKVSEQYRSALSLLLPSTGKVTTLDALVARDDESKIRAWLAEKVDDVAHPVTDVLAAIPDDLGLPVKKPAPREARPSAQKNQAWSGAVSDTNSDGGTRISRLDLLDKLMEEYEAEKARWEKYKNEIYPDACVAQAEVDAYDRLVSTYAPVVDAKLEAMWTVIVVRGQYHRVRKYVDLLNDGRESSA
ncbi:hypothetical protein B0T24DRAFT_638197 [Lasiosphaeria ovina]|uniref:Uncharacterized protein n=1 Tax=Lasiosphaeria ovina TaxID=92902 RepID=A0AAE0JXF2_9PEZI|nr:hypothetical protein B0T24DRAFT_638197 [Lasiosphaeria ovina]